MNELDRYRQLIALSADGVHELDLRGHIIHVNASGCAALGLAKAEEAQGRPLASFWPEPARDMLAACLATARAGESTQFPQILPSPSGEPGWWLVSVHPYLDGANVVDGIAVIIRDITETVEARVALDVALAGVRDRKSVV